MAFTLYDASVANYLQILGGVSGTLNKGLTHFRENGVDPETIVETRLAGDMWPLRSQVVSVAHHSLGAIEGVKAGAFSPGGDQSVTDYASLQKLINDAIAGLKALTPEEVNALEGKDVAFVFGDRKIPFTAENFLMSFSTPNLHFHATTAYDILRARGVPVGKRDYMGPLRMKAA